MSTGQSVIPNVDRASEKRFINEHGRRIEALERQKPADTTAEFGSWHQQIPLRYFHDTDPPPGWSADGYAFVQDASFSGGGYIEGTADGDFFTIMVLLGPTGSIWQINLRAAVGADFGRITFALASLAYESDARPSGDPTGKIAPVDGGYGSFTYIDLVQGASTFNFDRYSATVTGEQLISASIPFIVGGDEGDPLTDFDTGVTDPYTGFTLMDGGPGWYRMKVYTDGKNASSAGYRNQISDILLTRRADDNFP